MALTQISRTAVYQIRDHHSIGEANLSSSIHKSNTRADSTIRVRSSFIVLPTFEANYPTLLYHRQELLFAHDGYAELLRLLKLGRTHIATSEDEAGLA